MNIMGQEVCPLGYCVGTLSRCTEFETTEEEDAYLPHELRVRPSGFCHPAGVHSRVKGYSDRS